jgi:hypothetical protein
MVRILILLSRNQKKFYQVLHEKRWCEHWGVFALRRLFFLHIFLYHGTQETPTLTRFWILQQMDRIYACTQSQHTTVNFGCNLKTCTCIILLQVVKYWWNHQVSHLISRLLDQILHGLTGHEMVLLLNLIFYIYSGLLTRDNRFVTAAVLHEREI